MRNKKLVDEPVEAMELVHDLGFLPHDERGQCAMRISFGHENRATELAMLASDRNTMYQ